MIGYLYDEIHPDSVIEIPAGMLILTAAQDALDIVAVTGKCLGFDFNTVFVLVKPGDTIRDVCKCYDDGMKRFREIVP